MKIDFRKHCPVCGFAQKQLSCAETKVGVGFLTFVVTLDVGDSNLKQLGGLLNLPNLFLMCVPGAKLVGDVTNFKSKVLDVVRAQKPDLVILHIGSNDVGKDVNIFTSCYRDFIHQLLETNPTMLVSVCGILPRTMNNFKSLHWNSTVLPDLQRGCAALNDGIMNLSQECDKCHFIDYNPYFYRSIHLARDGLHVNVYGAYVLKTVLESFVVSIDMVPITSNENTNSLDMCRLVDTPMSYADVVKQFPPREKPKSMDYKDKDSYIVGKRQFIPKFSSLSRYRRYRVPVSKRVKKSHRTRRLEEHEILVNVSEDVSVILPPTAIHSLYKDRHIHAACTHQKPKLKRFIKKIIPAKVFYCPDCPVKCTKEDLFLNHYLSRHVPHRKKKEKIMCKDASFKENHTKDEIYTWKGSSHSSSITNMDCIALDVPGMQLCGMNSDQRDKRAPTVMSNCMSFVKRIAVFCWKNFARMKLILSGDVEENPGPAIQCSWESCTETFKTAQLLGQHVIGHIHPGMLCQWKDCVFTSYDGNELETHVLKHIYLEQFSFHSIEEWEHALPLGQLSTITTDLHLCPVPLRSKLHLLLLDEDFRMPPKYPYTIEHHSQYLSMLNSCNACEFEKQTAEFICKRQLLGENWTTDDSIEVITPISNSLLQETSLYPTDSYNQTLSRKRKSDKSEVIIPKNVFTTNLEKCHKAIYIEHDIISQLIECQFMDSKNKQLQQFEDSAINLATYPNCTEGVFIFTLLKIKHDSSEVPLYYMRYIESGYYKNFMVEKFSDLICEKLTISKESLFLCDIATDEDKKMIAQRKIKGSHKSRSRPDKVYKYNLSHLKERKLQLAEHAQNFTNLDLCACFVHTIRKGFIVKICTNVSDTYYMSCDNEMLKTPAIRDIICHYPEIRIVDHFEKTSVDFVKSFASVESLYEQSIMLNLLSNDHGNDIIKFRHRFSICSSAKSLRNKVLYLYRNKQFGELFKMYTDICHEKNHNNSASEDFVHHAEPAPKCRKIITPRGKIVTAEMVLKTVDIKNENVMKDISIYDNFKKQLLEYGDLVIQVFDEHKLIAVMNDYDDETGEFKNSEYCTTTRELFENGIFYTCTCRIYRTLLECFSDREQVQYDALDINGIKCMHCRILKEDIFPNIERDENAAITKIQAVIQRSLSFKDMKVVELSSCRPNTKKFSVLHDDEISFVHLTFSTRVQRFIISCTNGFCKSKKGFKRNVDLLTKGGNLCSHLLELKNAPHYWMEFSNCLFNDAADDLQTEAFPENVDVEMNIENQFSTGNDSNFNVDDGLWSFPCVSTHSARKQQDSKLAKNIRERYIWITSDFSNIENGCVKGPDLVNEIPEFPCQCGAGWTDLDHLNGNTVFDRTLTIYTKIAPVQCRVLSRICVKTEAPCKIKWDEGQSQCIHVATRDTAAGDEIGWAFVNQVLGSKVTFSSFCDLKTKDYRESNPDFRAFMDQVVFIKWWFSWASNMKIDFRKPCPVCGFAPKQLACDGTKVGVAFHKTNFEEISKPDEPDNILPTVHRRMTRCFLPDRAGIDKDDLKQAREHLHYISRLILNEIPQHEILPHEEKLNRNTLLLSLLCDSVKPVFKRFLAQMSEVENIVPDENIAFANVVKMLATTAPIISLIPHAYLNSIVELLDHMTGEKVNIGGDLFFNRKMQEMREYSPEIRDLIATSMLGNTENGEDCIRQDVVDFIRYLVTQVSELNVTPAEPALPQFGTYNPPRFGRAYYFSESGKKLRSVRKFSIDCERKTALAYDDPLFEHDRCEKYFSKTHISAPGTSSLFLWFCPNHGHCYGFHMTNAEGRKDPSASIYSHLETPPENIFYDFACNLHEYCLNRESGFFRDVRFFHDIFHGFAHKCSCAYRSSRLIGFDTINSSICEQFNSFIQCIKSSARQMTQEHFCFYLQFFIHEWNVRKRERYQKQMKVALAGV